MVEVGGIFWSAGTVTASGIAPELIFQMGFELQTARHNEDQAGDGIDGLKVDAVDDFHNRRPP